MRTRRWETIALACSALLGCVHGTHGTRTYQPGDAAGTPSVEALPSADVSESELTKEMRMARMLSAESLNLAEPALPADTSLSSYAAWSERDLKEWMRAKNHRAEAARRELDRAAVQNQRQRVMAGALVGLLYEDIARSLLRLPIPAELSTEPEIAAMYVDLVRHQAAPYLDQARRAYMACAGNAEQVATLVHWSTFCSTREELLPGAAMKSGETQVSVVRP
jgi:hypothetical protein